MSLCVSIKFLIYQNVDCNRFPVPVTLIIVHPRCHVGLRKEVINFVK